MEALLVSTLTVTLAEIGDKTQLLSLCLILKFRQPLQIALGILIATLLNHFATAYFGVWLADAIDPNYLQWGISLSFIVLAIWLLIPDKDEGISDKFDKLGVFGATTLLFFLAELGDKTQIATALLASQYQSLIWVTLGTTLGMLAANLPILFLGERLLNALPLQLFRWLAAGVACLIGVLGLVW
ncbi:TMEM165/GDT1 family protein [Pseudoalteromonas fenneropenaei]|uniref:GDT1 family protein n=1 Tax=Pseudoalteromonas fenneropenaei TaxID=1737459 RepID=A0ABV7CFF5_9GAMM